jgi:hypothetical protein
MTNSQGPATGVANRLRSRKKPIFGVASWILPCVALLVAYFTVIAATAADRARGDWLPGLDEAVASIFVISLCPFACGVIAILRRERYRWLGLPPLLAGLCALIYFSPDFLLVIFGRKP